MVRRASHRKRTEQWVALHSLEQDQNSGDVDVSRVTSEQTDGDWTVSDTTGAVMSVNRASAQDRQLNAVLLNPSRPLPRAHTKHIFTEGVCHRCCLACCCHKTTLIGLVTALLVTTVTLSGMMIVLFPHIPPFSLCNKIADVSTTLIRMTETCGSLLRPDLWDCRNGTADLLLTAAIYNPTRFEVVVNEVETDFVFGGTLIGHGSYKGARFPPGTISDYSMLARFVVPWETLFKMANSFVNNKTLLIDVNSDIVSATLSVWGLSFSLSNQKFAIKNYDIYISNRGWCLCDQASRPY